jgi:hypothetical protein
MEKLGREKIIFWKDSLLPLEPLEVQGWWRLGGSLEVLASDVDGSNLGLFPKKLSRVVCFTDFLLT